MVLSGLLSDKKIMQCICVKEIAFCGSFIINYLVYSKTNRLAAGKELD